MKRNIFCLLIVNSSMLLYAAVAYADIEFSSETIYAVACATVEIDVFAADPDGVGVLQGFNLPIDIGFGTDGDSVPVDLTFGSPFLTNPLFGVDDAFNDFSGFGLNLDIVANIIDPTGVGVAITETPTRIFTLTFTVDPSTAQGIIFDLSLIDQPDVPLFNVTGTDLGTPSIGTQGEIIVSLLGDVNRDETTNLLDVAPFVALLATGDYQVEADINKDGVLNLLDVAGFVALLAS